MFNLRSLLLFSILFILGLFIIQNLSTVLPLVVFGIKTPALPLGFWVLMAIVLGFISSLFLQLPRGFSSLPSEDNQRRNQRDLNREEFEEFPEPDSPPRKTQRYDRPAPESNPDLSDWDLDFNDDWQESAPVSPSPSKTTAPHTYQPSPKTTAPSPEPRDTPPNPPKTPSNFSSAVGDENKSGAEKTVVYDANYRVINAPFSPPSAVAKAQEEDWGLEEDDDSVFDFPEVKPK